MKAMFKDFKSQPLSVQFKYLFFTDYSAYYRGLLPLMKCSELVHSKIQDLLQEWTLDDRLHYQAKQFEFIDKDKLKAFRTLHMQVKIECPTYSGVLHK